MNSNARADLIFELADVLNEYDGEHDTEEVRDAALGYVKGWNSE